MPADAPETSRNSTPTRPVNSRLEQRLEQFANHDRNALARLITLVENRAPETSAIIERVYPLTGHAQVIGITGPPGAGKSTLVNRLIIKYRALGKRVAVLAIDPSSPFSGGAVLGDRVRMTDHYKDSSVYIRSLSSRGSHGGLSRAAREIVKLLDAFGHDIIVIETVGVGQTELSVMDLADTTVVVTVPEGGDSVQVMKAGLNEIADVFVVNKADRDGALRMVSELEQMLHLRPPSPWAIPVLPTEAVRGTGVDAVLDALERHRAFVSGDAERAGRAAARRAADTIDIVDEEVRRRLEAGLVADPNGLGALLESVRRGVVDPYSAALRILGDDAALTNLVRERPR